MKKFVVGMISALALFSATAYAKDLCSNLPGTWEGAGKVTFQIDSTYGFCIYRGTSNVTSSDPDAATFTSDVTLTLIEGPCPATVTWTVPGTCANNNITMASADGSVNLSGELLNKHVGTLTGTANFEVAGTVVEGKLDKTHLFKVK